MIWRSRYSPTSGAIDPEREHELRLVAQARAGAAWATSALVARYQPAVVRYLVRLVGNPERACVLAEQLFVRMGKRLRGPRGGEHLRLWLLRAATEMGLDLLRHPDRALPPRLAAPAGPAALLATRDGATPIGRLAGGWGGRARAAGGSQPLPRTQRFVWEEPSARASNGPAAGSADHGEWERLSPRESLRHRMVRAVLAELPYADAQCLALHLVAGLNQSEVAQALGVAAPVARRRIVQGLQIFGRRYGAALASLGLPEDFDAPASGPGHTAEEVALPLLTLREVALAETASALGLADDSAALPASTDGAERHEDAEDASAASPMVAAPSDDPNAASVAEANATSAPVTASPAESAGWESWWQRDARTSSRVDTELAVIVVEAAPPPVPDAPRVDHLTPAPAAAGQSVMDTLGVEAAGATDAEDGGVSGPEAVASSPHAADSAAPADAPPVPATALSASLSASLSVGRAATTPDRESPAYEDHYWLVVVADPDARTPTKQRPTVMSMWDARRARVLSADGEAEDPAVTQVLWRMR